MATTLIAATLASLLLAAPGAAKGPKKPVPKESPKEPAITVTVPPACSDVWKKVYTEFEPSWNVTVMEVRPADEKLPEPEVLQGLISRVEGLESALSGMDALDRDLFFVRLQTTPLAGLKKKYPKMGATLLESAKTESCRLSAGK